MTTEKRPHDIKARFLTSKAVLAVTFLILGFMSIALGKEVYRSYQINREITSVRDQIAQMKQKNDNLSNRLAYFQTQAFQEKEARKELNVQKQGETAVAIPPSKVNNLDSEKIQQAEQKSSSAAANSGNPSKWWNYFFSSSN